MYGGCLVINVFLGSAENFSSTTCTQMCCTHTHIHTHTYTPPHTHTAGEGAMSLLAVLSHQQEVLVAIVPSLLAALEKPQTLQSAANLCGAVREVVEGECTCVVL